MPSFYDQLSSCEVNLTESPISQDGFFPVTCLNDITKSNIANQLPFFSTRLWRRSLVDEIFQHAKKIFAILVLMGDPRTIRPMLKIGLTDEYLPLSYQETNDRTRSTILVSMKDGKQFNLSGIFTPPKLRAFHGGQWAVQAPIFDTYGQHFVLEAKCPLPLTTCGKMGDAPGQVYKATIHSAHFRIRGEVSVDTKSPSSG